MTEDQLKYANDVLYNMHQHLRKAKTAEVSTNEGYYDSPSRYPKEIIDIQTQQLRDWHKLRAYELAEEFAKL